jgi:hypothetical protein
MEQIAIPSQTSTMTPFDLQIPETNQPKNVSQKMKAGNRPLLGAD